jgi:hypothetical protein
MILEFVACVRKLKTATIHELNAWLEVNQSLPAEGTKLLGGNDIKRKVLQHVFLEAKN